MAHFRAEYEPILAQVVVQFPRFWAELPDSWFEDEDRYCEGSALEQARIETILKRTQENPEMFWTGEP